MTPSPRRLATRLTTAAIGAALAVGATACAAGETGREPSTDRQGVVSALADEVITPALLLARDAVVAADEATARYCADPSIATRETALETVDTALTSWERLDVMDMGPLMLLRTDSHVGYPVDTEKVEALIVEGPPQDADTVNQRTASSTRGLTTAEYLLLAEPEPGSEPVRCAYLLAVADDAVEEMQAAVVESVDGDGTTDPYYDALAGRGADPVDPTEVIDLVVNMFLSVLDTDAGALTEPDGQTPRAVRRASAAHLASIREVWGDGDRGLSLLVELELAEQLAEELAAAEAAVADPEVADVDAQAAVDLVRATIGTEVVSALDITIGFSDNDGDS